MSRLPPDRPAPRDSRRVVDSRCTQLPRPVCIALQAAAPAKPMKVVSKAYSTMSCPSVSRSNRLSSRLARLCHAAVTMQFKAVMVCRVLVRCVADEAVERWDRRASSAHAPVPRRTAYAAARPTRSSPWSPCWCTSRQVGAERRRSRTAHEGDQRGEHRVLDQVLTGLLTNETNDEILHLLTLHARVC